MYKRKTNELHNLKNKSQNIFQKSNSSDEK